MVYLTELYGLFNVLIRSCRPPSRQRCLATYICAAESFCPKSGFHRPKFAAPAGVAAGVAFTNYDGGAGEAL